MAAIPSVPNPPAGDPAIATVTPSPQYETAAASASNDSGWMVLLRIVGYLIVLPGAILVAVRYLFTLLG